MSFFRLLPARWLGLCGCLLLLVFTDATNAVAEEGKLEVQLVWGTNGEPPSGSNYKPLDESLAKKLGLEEGHVLPRSIIEFYYKNDALGDPMVSEEHITSFGWATPMEIDDMMHMAIRINDFLTGLFLGIGIKLVDFKIEFGRLFENDMMRVVLADEISPDSCRLWDTKTLDKMDKDRFRRDMGGLVEAYHEVARRLGIIQPNEQPERSKPKLVKTD